MLVCHQSCERRANDERHNPQVIQLLLGSQPHLDQSESHAPNIDVISRKQSIITASSHPADDISCGMPDRECLAAVMC